MCNTDTDSHKGGGGTPPLPFVAIPPEKLRFVTLTKMFLQKYVFKGQALQPLSTVPGVD